MNKTLLRYLLILLTLVAFFNCRNSNSVNRSFSFEKLDQVYPNPELDSTQVDKYGEVEVADPFRWLEDPSSEKASKWINVQQSITQKYLDQIPYRLSIRERLRDLWNYERFSLPEKVGKDYYVFKNNGLQKQDVLYKVKEDGSLEEVLNPNKLSQTGEFFLDSYAFSKNGKFLAFQVSKKGSDLHTIFVQDLSSGKRLEDKITGVAYSKIAWHGDGFYYSAYQESEIAKPTLDRFEFHQLFFHKLGTSQEEDEVVLASRSDPLVLFNASTTSDEQFLVVKAKNAKSNHTYYFKDLNSPGFGFKYIGEQFPLTNDFQIIDNLNKNLFFLTNYQAPNGRLIRINANNTEESNWSEIIPNSEDVLDQVYLIGNKFVAVYIHNASHLVKVFDLNGQFEKDLALPNVGKVIGFSGDKRDSKAYFSFTSFTQPNTIYELDMEHSVYEAFQKPAINFNLDDFVTEQVWYESYDRSRIPMFIIHKKDIRLDGQRPTLLYGIGGLQKSVLPEFDPTGLMLFPLLLENYGVCAVANLRGGGEFGLQWHKAGSLENKHKSFDDFQAAAEFLMSEKYTNAQKLAIYGGSDGSTLINASITQRPDLFQVAIPSMEVSDLLRYQNFSIGWTWKYEYGLSDDPEDFSYLYQISPFHSIKSERYPATLITTSLNNTQVAPLHSLKMAAKMQRNQFGDLPILLRIGEAGDRDKRTISERIEEGADVASFMFYELREYLIYAL